MARVHAGPGIGLVRRKLVYSFGWKGRWVVSSVALVLHTFSFVYLFCFALVYHVVPDDQAKILLVFAPRTTAAVHMILALLHLRGAVHIVFPRCINRRILVYDPAKHPTTWLGKVKHLYVRCFSRHGLFGLHGELNDVRVAVKHVIQITSQAYEARMMSQYLTRPDVCSMYTVVLAAGCLVVPCMLYSRHPLVRRYGTALVDAILNFSLAAGTPLFLLYRAIVDYYMSGDDSFILNRNSLNQMIMLARGVSVTSPVKLASATFLFGSSFMSLKNIHAAVHMKQVEYVDVHLASDALASLAIGNLRPLKDAILRHCRLSLLCVCIAGSIFLLATAANATARGACPSGCLHQTYPWFSQTCHCVVMRQNCRLHPVANSDVDTFLVTELPHVFDLELSQCDLPHGLSKSTLQSLDNLYSLTLRQTKLVDWNLDPTDFPVSMFALYLMDLHMPEMPAIMARNAHNLQYIFLRNVSLTHNNTIPIYSKLYQLALSGVGLVDIPSHVRNLTTLSNFEADYNHLTEMPRDMLTLPSLQSISLMYNDIATVSLEALNIMAPTLHTVYLDGNPIDALPPAMDVDILLTKRVRIQGTPLCARLGLAVATDQVSSLPQLEQEIARNWHDICAFDCNVGCHEQLITDAVCELVCLTPGCNYDAPKHKYDLIGIAASDCYGVVTGWEVF